MVSDGKSHRKKPLKWIIWGETPWKPPFWVLENLEKWKFSDPVLV